jgi:hypothetical protein
MQGDRYIPTYTVHGTLRLGEVDNQQQRHHPIRPSVATDLNTYSTMSCFSITIGNPLKISTSLHHHHHPSMPTTMSNNLERHNSRATCNLPPNQAARAKAHRFQQQRKCLLAFLCPLLGTGPSSPTPSTLLRTDPQRHSSTTASCPGGPAPSNRPPASRPRVCHLRKTTN